MQDHCRATHERLKNVFEANPCVLTCSVCDLLCFDRDLKKAQGRNIPLLQAKLPGENARFHRRFTLNQRSCAPTLLRALFF